MGLFQIAKVLDSTLFERHISILPVNNYRITFELFDKTDQNGEITVLYIYEVYTNTLIVAKLYSFVITVNKPDGF